MKPKYRVADKITDGAGTVWVVGRVWELPHCWDYELINVATGERGDLCERKENQPNE